MSDLPVGWVATTLGTVTCPVRKVVTPRSDERRPYVGMEHVEPHSTKIIGFGKASELRSGTAAFGPGDTLYGRLRPYLNKVAVADFEGLASAEFMIFQPTPLLAPKFLMYFLNRPSFVEYASHLNEGDRPRVKWDQIRSCPFLLPPLTQQRRIVAAIEEHFSRLDEAQRLLCDARRGVACLRSSALDAVTPQDGKWTTLGDIADIVGGVTKDSKRQADPSFVEVPYLRVANVQRGFLDLREITTIRVAPERAKALKLEPGDILFNEGGDRDKLGRGWVWQGQIEECIHQNHVFRARLLTDKFEPKYVSLHGNTYGQQWFERMGRQTTNLASINLRTLKAFPVPDLPVDTQRRIVTDVERELTILEAISTAIDHALMRTGHLRRSILERAFSGQLVPHDPSDEAAGGSPGLGRSAPPRPSPNGGRRHE
jgi:type I restriction enzyme S subunit